MEVDPFVELVEHEIGKLGTIHALKMCRIVENPTTNFELQENTELRSYKYTYDKMANGQFGHPWVKENFKGKAYRQKMQEWAVTLRQDARGMILSGRWTAEHRGTSRAMKDFGEAIIGAFKKL